MESFDAFDFGSTPLYNDSPNTNEVTDSTIASVKAEASPLDIPFPEHWDQLSDQCYSGSFGLQNLFDDSFIMPQDDEWDSKPQPQTIGFDTLSSGPSQHPTPTTDLEGWDPVEDRSTLKRSRTSAQDSKSACWTSPLCPAFKKEGTPPDPSTCDGGCASHLFDNHAITEIVGGESPFTTSPSVVEASPVEPRKPQRKTKARGIIMSMENEKSNSKRQSSEELTTDPGSPHNAKPSRRQPHNEVERKYRESINTHLQSLKKAIPAFQPKAAGEQDTDIEDLGSNTKPSKGAILAGAVAHIRRLDKEKKQLEQEKALLKQQVKALQALVKCEDCSLMQYIMPLNLRNSAAQARAAG